MTELFELKTILGLACAAQRRNRKYIKDSYTGYPIEESEGKIFSNKSLILATLGYGDRFTFPPKNLVISEEDIRLSNTLEQFSQRFVFNAIAAEDDYKFETSLHSILNKGEITKNEIGVIAYLPEYYFKYQQNKKIKKYLDNCEPTYLGEPTKQLTDLDSEIIEVFKSKNYDAYNVLAIINNKLASWMSNKELNLGPAVIVKAKIKQHSTHYKHGTPTTRLHYVIAAQ